MAESAAAREQLLREEFHGQTARIHWHDLQTYYARGSVVLVENSLNLVEVAVQLGMDNSHQFSQWIAGGEVSPVSDEQALCWYEDNRQFWAVVAPPWILLQTAETGSGEPSN